MADLILGRLAVAYYNTTGLLILPGAPHDEAATWLVDGQTLHAENVVDVDYDIGSEQADATTRETAKEGFRSNVPVLRNGQMSFEMRWKPVSALVGSTDFTSLLMAAWQTDSPIAMIFLDWDYQLTPPSGGDVFSSGLAANWAVSLTKTEALSDVQRISVTLSVVSQAVWYTHQTKATTPP